MKAKIHTNIVFLIFSLNKALLRWYMTKCRAVIGTYLLLVRGKTQLAQWWLCQSPSLCESRSVEFKCNNNSNNKTFASIIYLITVGVKKHTKAHRKCDGNNNHSNSGDGVALRFYWSPVVYCSKNWSNQQCDEHPCKIIVGRSPIVFECLD